MSADEFGEEPIRELSHEQASALVNMIREARAAASEKRSSLPMAKTAERIAEAEASAAEEGLVIGRRVWELRKNGHSRDKIARRLRVSPEMVETCLVEFERRMTMSSGRAIEHYMRLDLELVDESLQRWVPLLQHEDDDRALRAAHTLYRALELRLKILAAARPSDSIKESSTTNVLLWLQQVLPGAQRLEARGARETLVFETEAEREHNGHENPAAEG